MAILSTGMAVTNPMGEFGIYPCHAVSHLSPVSLPRILGHDVRRRGGMTRVALPSGHLGDNLIGANIDLEFGGGL